MDPRIASSDQCPSQDELRAFSSGKLDDARESIVAEHLRNCLTCQAFLESHRDDSDTVIGLLRSSSLKAADESVWQKAELRARGPVDLGEAATTGRPFPNSFGGYTLGKFIGQGGMGTVYEAQHVKLKRRAVVKFLSPRRLGDPDAIARFHREMEAIGRFSDAHIMLAHDAGEVDGHFYLVMEHVDGVDLRKLLAWGGPLPIVVACELIKQAAAGLACAHQNGVIHRDVKPSNLFVSTAGQVKILDLGLALLGPPGEKSDRSGTPAYMAPEQTLGKQVDRRSDIYSLGCTLFKLLTGYAPLEASANSNRAEVGGAPSLAEFRPDAPTDLCSLVDRMLAPSPADRFRSMDDVVAALAPLARGADVAGQVLPCFVAARETESDPAGRTLSQRLAAVALPARAVWGQIAIWMGISLLLLALWPASLWMTSPSAPTALPTTVNLLADAPLPWADHGLHGKTAVHGFLPEGGYLVQATDDSAWLCSASTPPGPVQLNLELSEPKWLDGTGVFFGAHESPDDSSWRCQAILVKPTVNAEDLPVLDIYWRSLATTVGFGQESDAISMHRVAMPAPGDRIRLEVVLGDRGLQRVRWNGQELNDLMQPAEMIEKARTSYVSGGVGLWNGGGTTWFHRFTMTLAPTER